MDTTAAPDLPTAPARPHPRPAARSAALDIARGAAMILVVWGHSMLGVQAALGTAPPGRFAVTAIYAVHMPLFFFLSGLLSRSAMTEPAAAFANRLLTRFAYPYILWSILLLVVHRSASDYTNTRVGGFSLLSLLYAPPAVMWFLYVLAFCFVATRALRGLPPSQRLALGAALATGGSLLDLWLLHYLRFAGIFLIASTLSPPAVLDAARSRRVQALAATALILPALCALQAAGHPPDGYPAHQLRYLPAAAGGVVLLLAAAQTLERRHPAPARLLTLIGARTMPIFLAHVMIVAGLRIALLRLGLHDGAAIVALATPLGVALPILAFAAADRLSLTPLLGWR